jgi:Fe-S cluster biogenesis protein NfuA
MSGAEGQGLQRSVEAELTSVRQRLRSHGGDLKVVDVADDGRVEVEFLGACCGCPAVNFTFSAVVVPAIEAVEGTSKVSSKQARYSRLIAARAGLSR